MKRRTCVETTFVPLLHSPTGKCKVGFDSAGAVSAALACQVGAQTIRGRSTVPLQEKNFWASSWVPDPVKLKKLTECRDGYIGGRQRGGRGRNDANDNGHCGTTGFWKDVKPNTGREVDICSRVAGDAMTRGGAVRMRWSARDKSCMILSCFSG